MLNVLSKYNRKQQIYHISDLKIMVRPRSFVLCVAAVFVCFFESVTAFSQTTTMSLQLTYRVGLGHAELATTDAKWVFGNKSFEVVAVSQTVGLTEMFRKYRGRAELSGKIEGGKYLPIRLLISSMSDWGNKEAASSWTSDTSSVITKREPALDLEKVFPLVDKHIKDAIDPLSAMLNMLNNISQIGSCAGSESIYDGLRTSEITLFDLGSDYLEKDRPFAFEGTVLKCGFVSKPTGGHQRKSRWQNKQPAPDDILIYIAEVRPTLFLPVRMEARSFLGNLTVRLAMPSLKVEQ